VAAEGRVNVKLLYSVTVEGTPACLTVVETIVTILWLPKTSAALL